MAHHAPTKEELKWYEDTLKKDPLLNDALSWDDLPFYPQWTDPEYYVPIISRDEWGALPSKGEMEPLKKPVFYIRYTTIGKECESVEECSAFIRKLQETSMAEGLPDIPYNFLVGGKGIVYEGRGWDWEADREKEVNEREGMHGPLKGKTVDIAYIGDYSFYSPDIEILQGAAHFVMKHNLGGSGYIDDMFDTITFRKEIKDYTSPDAYYKMEDLPEALRKQINTNMENSEFPQ